MNTYEPLDSSRDQNSTTAAETLSKTCLPILSCVYSRVLSHFVALFCQPAASLSFFHCALLVTLPMVGVHACVLNLSLSVL